MTENSCKHTTASDGVSPRSEQSAQQRVSNDWLADTLLTSLGIASHDDRAASRPAAASDT